MTTDKLERRIDALEREVQRIKSAMSRSRKRGRPWWEQLAGSFKDDELFDEVVKAGQKFRKRASSRPR